MGQGHSWLSHTSRLSKPEALTLVLLIAIAVVFDIVSIASGPGDVTKSQVVGIVTTLSLALYLYSPLVATVALAAVVLLAFALGVPGDALGGAAGAALLVNRLGSTPLVLSYGAGLLICTVGLINDDEVLQANTAIFLALTTVGGAIGLALRVAADRGTRLEQRLAEQAEHEKEAIAAERRWIAGELHDSIAHHLTIISLHSQMLDDERMRPTSQAAIQESARKALADLRFIINISEESSAADPRPNGDLVQAFSEAKEEILSAGHQVALNGDPIDEAIPRGIEIILARTVRESATNIIKYAGPGTVHFGLDVYPESISLEIRSPISKTGARVVSSTGTGINRMAARVASLGGQLNAGVEGDEWVVFTRLPIETSQAPTGKAPSLES